MATKRFLSLLAEVRACDTCAYHLRVAPKPVVQLNEQARILVIAQAPGARARASGKPFDDPSGDRLRAWMGVGRDQFYDETKFAFMPMGFCYPGSEKGGDLPPCAECAPLWHPQILPHLLKIKLTLLVGGYAHRYYLNSPSVTKAVESFRGYLPKFLPLPHPSWHNTNWLTKNPWFETDVLPILRSRIAEHLGSTSSRG